MEKEDRSLTTADWTISAGQNAEGRPVVIVKKVADPDTQFAFPNTFVKDISYPPFCALPRWDMLNEVIKYRESDILVVTYPKCGTTWAEQATLLLLNGGRKEALNPMTKNTYTGGNSVGKIWPEACINQDPVFHQRNGAEFAALSLTDFDAAPAPRVIKSHAPQQLLVATYGESVAKLPAGTKTVVVTRNPLDACVSAYYHAWNPYKSGWPFSGKCTAYYRIHLRNRPTLFRISSQYLCIFRTSTV
jgi:hypothetical protein